MRSATSRSEGESSVDPAIEAFEACYRREYRDDDCEMMIPITVSWTGEAASGVIGLRLQFGYSGRQPEAADGLELTIVTP